MDAYLIDPYQQQVTTVQYNGDYNQIYALIECDCFDIARINDQGDGIFVDDEGLFKEQQAFFTFKGYANPLAGKGLVLGTNAEGDSVSPKLTLDEVKSKVMFVMPARINGQLVMLPI
jgi:hypothetical protein